MRILSVKVPEFRALRDVHLVMDSAIEPQIFPIGSVNGAGKSTLLQLIFALLHCSVDSSRCHFVRNLLSGNPHHGPDSTSLIARVTLEMEGLVRTLDFISIAPIAVDNALDVEGVQLGFDSIGSASERSRRLAVQKSRLEEAETLVEELQVAERTGDAGLTEHVKMRLLRSQRVDGGSRRMARQRGAKDLWSDTVEWRDRLAASLQEELNQHLAIEDHANRVQHWLAALDHHLVTTYRPSPKSRWHAIAVTSPDDTRETVEHTLSEAAKNIFLLGPSTQQYLFLPRASRKSLTTEASTEADSGRMAYVESLAACESQLPGFFAYDWLAVSPMLKLFKKARDLDFAQAVATGDYGNNYTSMLQEVNELLLNKKVRPSEDISDIEFSITKSDGSEAQIGLEDLSRGELKRLMIYAWLKSMNSSAAVVFMDEVEISFHPDWQYGIVRDLGDWAPEHQFILATHSHDLCQALAPSNVLELGPTLAPEARDK